MKGKRLFFSYIGMKNAERLLKGTTSFIKIQMEAETSELDQVVITGYTQTTFKKMTGSSGSHHCRSAKRSGSTYCRCLNAR